MLPFDPPKPARNMRLANGKLSLAPELAHAHPHSIVVACDGSSRGNPGPAGWAWFVDQHRWRAGGQATATSNRMELKAVAGALIHLPEHRDVVIACDSRYTIDCCTRWLPGFRRRNWTTSSGTPVHNADMIRRIGDLIDSRPGKVTFVWVKGHAGHALNEAADRAAQAASKRAQHGHVEPTGPGWGN